MADTSGTSRTRSYLTHELQDNTIGAISAEDMRDLLASVPLTAELPSLSGYSGFSGYSGYSGISGYSGYSGISGYSGYSGISGYSGYSGISGYSGYSGISGYSGYSGISGYSGYTITVEAVATTPHLITAAETAKIFTNEGATQEIVHTLPTAADALIYTFIVEDADGIKVTAAAGDTIRIGSSVSKVAGYVEATDIGSTLELIAINSTEWIGVYFEGAWTVEVS